MKICTLLLALGLITGCNRSPKSGEGFVFPEGNAENGKKAFVDMKCYKCHRIAGVTDLPAPTVSPGKVMILGGKMPGLRTYGDLVTSIIHPSYELSENFVRPERGMRMDSPMKAVNEKMTVEQLLDIVTFLQPRFKELEPLYSQEYKVP